MHMSSAARYFSRAPRYVFRPDDESLMRFAGMEPHGSILRARIHDLSTTGLSIVVASGYAPEIGEMLKIEFGLPGSRQVAWFATVVRVERKNSWDPDLGDREYTLVGLRFRQLPAPFASAIKRSLESRIESTETTNLLEAGPDTAHERKMFWFMGAVLAILLALMALPPSIWLHPFYSLFK